MSPAAPPAPGALRVLIADRPGPARRALATLLAGLPGIAVVGAEDAGPVLTEEIERLRPDVVVVDDRLLTEWSRPAGARIRMIVVGADDDPAYATRAARLHADAWLPKERSAELLSGVLRRARAPQERCAARPPALAHTTGG